MDRLTSMAVFVRAADLGSFAAAADELGLSAPMVGKHVRFLEERLRVRLINRTTRRQTLTEFGRTYYERCRTILAQVDAADALATDQVRTLHGRLRVTLPVHFGRHCALPVLLDVGRRYPELELDLSFGDRLLDLAEDGYDLAIRTGDLASAPGLVARRVARQVMVVCAAPSYLARHGRPVRIEDLEHCAALVYRRSGPAAPWLFPGDGGVSLAIAPPGRFRFDDLDAIADAACTGAGVAWLPRWLVRERLRSGDLVDLFSEQEGFLYDVHAVWLQAPHVPRRIRVAVDALAAALPALMA
jgi:DNA-binding transcriptional LysR family regulator